MKPLIYILILFILLLSCKTAIARKVRVYNGLPRTEEELMKRVLKTLQNRDTLGYYYLFPTFDTLWQMVIHNTDHSPQVVEALNELIQHPTALIDFDPKYNHDIMGRYCYVLQKGLDSGIHWDAVTLMRYELQMEPMTRALIGFDKISPERFMGYMFVRDVSGRVTYCITIKEIQKLNGFFVGGQVHNIIEASTIDRFLQKEEFERNYTPKVRDTVADSIRNAFYQDSLHKDSLKNGWLEILNDSAKKRIDSIAAKRNRLNANMQQDDDTVRGKKMIVDRKYYEGMFDEEIPVELFIRYMKISSNGKVEYWDGLYKFGDQERYVKLEITKNKEGKWIMDDDPPLGSMELDLKDKTFTGTWTNNETQAGYDAVLTEKGISPKKMDMLDDILEKGLAGRTDQMTKDDIAQEEAKNKKHKKRRGRKGKQETEIKKEVDDDE